MALEELHSTVSKLSFNLFGSETEKRIGGFLFDEKTEWASSRELHGLAALTFNEEQCAGAMSIIGKALEPKDNTWRSLLKALKLLHHFVLFGAERCVDHAWDHQRKVEALRRYNSAIHGRTAAINGGGTDFGGPVRKAAEALDELLKDSGAIRVARARDRPPDALIPLGQSDDYTAPVVERPLDLGTEDAFGVIPQGTVGAKYDLQRVPGFYEGRPDRYFDNKSDPRNARQEVEDSDYTRQAQAPDLLDLDIGEAHTASVPDAQDLVRVNKEVVLEQKLREQQQQLEQLKQLVRTKAGQSAGAGGVSGGVAAGGFAPAMAARGTGLPEMGRGPLPGSSSVLTSGGVVSTGIVGLGSGSGPVTSGTRGRVEQVTDAFASLEFPEVAGRGAGAGGRPMNQIGVGGGMMSASLVRPQLAGGAGLGVAGADGVSAGAGIPDIGMGMNRQGGGLARNGVGAPGVGLTGMACGSGVGAGVGVSSIGSGPMGAEANVANLGISSGQYGQLYTQAQRSQKQQMGAGVANMGKMGGVGGALTASAQYAGAMGGTTPAARLSSGVMGGLGQQFQGQNLGYGARMGADGFQRPNASGGSGGLT